jgi:hypothetical protein
MISEMTTEITWGVDKDIVMAVSVVSGRMKYQFHSLWFDPTEIVPTKTITTK